jgi:ATPase family associated with various cellular activities (AAA)
MDDLVLLRTTVENWAKVASEAVYNFRRDDGSFRKDSRSPRESNNKAPHITTSARAYVALLYADRQLSSKGAKLPEWYQDFKKFVERQTVGRQDRQFLELLKDRREKTKIDPYEFNTFDIAHLADYFQVADYLKRFYASSPDVDKFFKLEKGFEFDLDEGGNPAGKVDDDYNSKTAREMIEARLRDSIQEAAGAKDVGVGFPGEVRFEQERAESRHYFATLHTLRALHVLGATKIEGLDVVVNGARSFAIEQSYYFQRGATHRQDPVRLAFAGCIYAIYDEHVDKDLCLAIVEALAAGQQENGSWPATHPIFRKNSTPWHIASHEVALCLSWLYFQPRVPDPARPLIVGMMRKYLLSGVIPAFVRGSSNSEPGSSGQKLDGWQDDHTVSLDTTLGWATAIVCHFLSGFTQVLNDWINRRVIEELGLQLATKRYLIDDTASSPSTRWARTKERLFVWPDLPPHGWLKEKPNPMADQNTIESNWTDPTVGAAISRSLAEKVLAPIHGNPNEQPRRDRCAGLMPGSPGTRKTSLVKEVSEVLRWPMVGVPASSIFEDGFDRMEARANRVFGLLNHLRGCVIFFDEFEEFFLSRGEDDRVSLRPREATAPVDQQTSQNQASPVEVPGNNDGSRDETIGVGNPHASNMYMSRTIAAFTTSAMLPRLQDLHDQGRCLIFLATNYPSKLDSAIKRIGRFDFTITVEHPTIARLTEYLSKLSPKTMKLTDLVGSEPVDVENLLAAVRQTLAKYGTSAHGKSVKFAIVEEILRQVRPIERRTPEDLEKDATEILQWQLRAAEGGNPPELDNL